MITNLAGAVTGEGGLTTTTLAAALPVLRVVADIAAPAIVAALAAAAAFDLYPQCIPAAASAAAPHPSRAAIAVAASAAAAMSALAAVAAAAASDYLPLLYPPTSAPAPIDLMRPFIKHRLALVAACGVLAHPDNAVMVSDATALPGVPLSAVSSPFGGGGGGGGGGISLGSSRQVDSLEPNSDGGGGANRRNGDTPRDAGHEATAVLCWLAAISGTPDSPGGGSLANEHQLSASQPISSRKQSVSSTDAVDADVENAGCVLDGGWALAVATGAFGALIGRVQVTAAAAVQRRMWWQRQQQQRQQQEEEQEQQRQQQQQGRGGTRAGTLWANGLPLPPELSPRGGLRAGTLWANVLPPPPELSPPELSPPEATSERCAALAAAALRKVLSPKP
jgi:hypothetical protein